nr:immunoglobulin heavy chain junction region [Homo sapiens]
CGHSHILLCTQ